MVCTHAHSDHCGQAATIVERAGCELWMHPNHEHLNAHGRGSRRGVSRGAWRSRARAACPRSRCAATRPSAAPRGSGIAGPIEPDRDLLDRRRRSAPTSASGSSYETPGHAPSHVCLFQPERRLLISGDHLLGRISLYFDYGYSPDPVGEFLSSLDVVERLGARLCLAGHGRTFTDVHAHIQRQPRARRRAPGGVCAARSAERRADGVRGRAATSTASSLSQQNAHWLLSKMLCYLTHLEALGEARRIAGEPERWAA